MTFDKRMLYYDNIALFKEQYYKALLSFEHVKGGEIKLSSLHYTSGVVEEEANFWGYVLEKDNIKYLFPTLNDKKEKVNLRDLLPIKVKETVKVAAKGVAYQLIEDYTSFKIRPEPTMSFRELVDRLSSLDHSNKKAQKLLWFKELTQDMGRANFRVASPAGCGKDSTVDIIGNLIGGSATIESPTLAKLEERASILKHLAVNEVVDMTETEWRWTQQFLLATGAFKPEITKHSRAHGNVGETIDISRFSLSLFYNDIDHYPDLETYFDTVTKEQVKDRFPALRVYGTFTEDFTAMNRVNKSEFVQQHMDDYVELIRAFLYYRAEIREARYHSTLVAETSSRDKTNMGQLFMYISHYCNSKEEYDEWINYVRECQEDYYVMLDYPHYHEKLRKKLGTREFAEEIQRIKSMNNCPYSEKIAYIKTVLSGEKDVKAQQTATFWKA